MIESSFYMFTEFSFLFNLFLWYEEQKYEPGLYSWVLDLWFSTKLFKNNFKIISVLQIFAANSVN